MERNPSNWVKQLPLAAFAANNVVNASTGYTPFYLKTGQDLVVPMSLLESTTQKKSQVVNDMAEMGTHGFIVEWEQERYLFLFRSAPVPVPVITVPVTVPEHSQVPLGTEREQAVPVTVISILITILEPF